MGSQYFPAFPQKLYLQAKVQLSAAWAPGISQHFPEFPSISQYFSQNCICKLKLSAVLHGLPVCGRPPSFSHRGLAIKKTRSKSSMGNQKILKIKIRNQATKIGNEWLKNLNLTQRPGNQEDKVKGLKKKSENSRSKNYEIRKWESGIDSQKS